jgi:hypothetical protein
MPLVYCAYLRIVISRWLCEERKQLAMVYLGAVRKTAVAGMRILNAKSEGWREATLETRAACDVAVADLNRHLEEHGC